MNGKKKYFCTGTLIPAYVPLYIDKPAGDLLWTKPRVVGKEADASPQPKQTLDKPVDDLRAPFSDQ